MKSFIFAACMIDPFYIEGDDLLIHPFRPEDLERYQDLAHELFQLFSDTETLTFLPEKKLESLQEAENRLKLMVLDHYSGRSYVHFIRETLSDKLLGLIEIITPVKARQYYTLENYPYFIEFCLQKSAMNKSLMSSVLPIVINRLNGQGIQQIGAVVNRANLAAGRVLSKSGFSYHSAFDQTQDLYTS